MSVLDELARSCERRGLRLCLVGETRDGLSNPGLYLTGLEVQSHDRRFIAGEVVDGLCDNLELDRVAFALAQQVVEALQ